MTATSEPRQRMLAVLAASPVPLLTREAATRAGMPRIPARKLLQTLLDEGKVHQTVVDGQPGHQWALPQTSEAAAPKPVPQAALTGLQSQALQQVELLGSSATTYNISAALKVPPRRAQAALETLRALGHLEVRDGRWSRIKVESSLVPAQESLFHPLCLLFPYDDETVKTLAEDIRIHGQLEPVVTHHGQILDGRHRWAACKHLGLEARTIEFSSFAGDAADPETWVFSKNLMRRQLTTSQRAVLAARLAELRRKHGRPIGTGVDIMAQKLGISERTVSHAAAVLRDGTPELIHALEAGLVRAAPAADLAKLPADKQRQLVANADRTRIKRVAKAIRLQQKPPEKPEHTLTLTADQASSVNQQAALTGQAPAALLDQAIQSLLDLPELDQLLGLTSPTWAERLEAVAKHMNAPSSAQPIQTPQKSTQASQIDSAAVLLRLQRGESVNKIASDLRVDRDVIRTIRNSNSVKHIPAGGARHSSDEEIKEQLLAGKSTHSIVIELKTSKERVVRIRNALGIVVDRYPKKVSDETIADRLRRGDTPSMIRRTLGVAPSRIMQVKLEYNL